MNIAREGKKVAELHAAESIGQIRVAQLIMRLHSLYGN